jgi:hypothetical protein
MTRIDAAVRRMDDADLPECIALAGRILRHVVAGAGDRVVAPHASTPECPLCEKCDSLAVSFREGGVVKATRVTSVHKDPTFVVLVS